MVRWGLSNYWNTLLWGYVFCFHISKVSISPSFILSVNYKCEMKGLGLVKDQCSHTGRQLLLTCSCTTGLANSSLTFKFSAMFAGHVKKETKTENSVNIVMTAEDSVYKTVVKVKTLPLLNTRNFPSRHIFNIKTHLNALEKQSTTNIWETMKVDCW